VASQTGEDPRRAGVFLKKKWIHFLVAIGLLALISWVESAARKQGRDPRSGRVGSASSTERGRFLFGYLLGGLRAPVVGIYWLKVDLSYKKGRYFAIERDLRSLAELNPLSEQVWDYAAWHQAFNVARRAATEDEKFRRRYEGLGLARKGLQLLPQSRTLLMRLALIARRLGEENDHDRFRRVEAGRTPEAVEMDAYERLVALPSAAPRDRILFASAAEYCGARFLLERRFGRAGRVFMRGIEELDRARAELPESVRAALPIDLARYRETLEQWRSLAGLAAASRANAAREALARIRAGYAEVLEADHEFMRLIDGVGSVIEDE